MAKISHCGGESRAKVYRLASSKPAYEYQHVYHCLKCKPCGQELMFWKGEYPNGTFTELVGIPRQEFPHWLRRIQAGEAKPEAQLMSEWAEKAARPADVAIHYHTKLCQAHRWYKGERVKNEKE